MTPVRWVLGGMAALVLVALVVFGGYKAHWWLYANSVKQQYQINNSSQEHQGSLLSGMRDDFPAWQQDETAAKQAPGSSQTWLQQAVSEKRSFCAALPQLTIVPADIKADAQAMGSCSAAP